MEVSELETEGFDVDMLKEQLGVLFSVMETAYDLGDITLDDIADLLPQVSKVYIRFLYDVMKARERTEEEFIEHCRNMYQYAKAHARETVYH